MLHSFLQDRTEFWCMDAFLWEKAEICDDPKEIHTGLLLST